MCRKVIWFGVIAAFLFAETATAQQYAFQVTFTDKNNTPYSFSSPLVYLSARSLARRATQGIALDSTDLPVNPDYVNSVLSLTGGVFSETSRWLNMCIILLPTGDSAEILNLAGKPFIKDVKQVGSYCANLFLKQTNNPAPAQTSHAQRTTTPDADYYNNTWIQTALVAGNSLHDNGYNGTGKLIAVFDAGFSGTDTHPWFDSLWADDRVADNYDFTHHNSNVFGYDAHGTMVLSTMAGYAPGTYVGSAPLATYALYITENDVDDQPVELDNMIAGAERADSLGVDVITESLGYDLFQSNCNGQIYPNSFDSLDGKTTVAAKAADIATKKGILFVATAGNDGDPVPGWGTHILTPGDADSALTIGSTDNTGNVWISSGYGPNAAGQIKPDVCAMGHGAEVFIGSSSGASDGTSFSTPQIAGWAACLWEANPSATPYQIRQAIIRCASDYSSPGTHTGYGVPNFACTAQMLNIKDTPPPFSTANWVIAAPNPFSDQLKISVDPIEDGYVDFLVTDMDGRKVVAMQQYFYSGAYNTPVVLAMPRLAAGIYILKAVSSSQQKVIKLEKL